jgi:transcription initiation factor TFIIIB Brf1 subunit/transcription initiation factor TFIIB
MSEFTLFNQALAEYKKMKISDEQCLSEPNSPKENITSCSHENVISEKGVSVCVDCGEEILHRMTYDKEWRYYGQSDTKHSSDPNRVQMRKSEERSIFKDVENLGFSESIIAKANKIYAQVTEGKIFRGNHRKAIVFACVFHAYKMSGKPQSHERLIQIFNLSRKTGLRGLKYVNLYAPKDSKIRTTYITPIHLISEIMEKFSATTEQTQEVVSLYEQIKNKSSRLNRSRPQSVASGLVFYWICIKGKEITLKDFAKKVILSELTINRIAKEIAEVLETPNIV